MGTVCAAALRSRSALRIGLSPATSGPRCGDKKLVDAQNAFRVQLSASFVPEINRFGECKS